MSILESPRHELRIAYGLTLVHPSLRGWEAFPTPGALAHTRITWALSPTAPQVPGVTPGSPLCPWCFGHSSWRGARHHPCDSVLPPTNSGPLLRFGAEKPQPIRRVKSHARPNKNLEFTSFCSAEFDLELEPKLKPLATVAATFPHCLPYCLASHLSLSWHINEQAQNLMS